MRSNVYQTPGYPGAVGPASLSPEAGHLIGAVATAAGLVQTATGQDRVTL